MGHSSPSVPCRHLETSYYGAKERYAFDGPAWVPDRRAIRRFALSTVWKSPTK
jgi:hypothetical protein